MSGSPDKVWMDEELDWLNEEYDRYMHARQVLSTLSASTLRRHRPFHLRQVRRNKAEDEFMHRLVAAQHTYQTQSILCAKSDAHFAAALMAVSAIDCLMLASFIQLKSRVKVTAEYKKILRSRKKQSQKIGKVQQKKKAARFHEIVAKLRIEEQYKIVFQIGLLTDKDLIDPVVDALNRYGERGAAGLLRFVRSARNQLHANKFVETVDDYALSFDVMYSPEKIVRFQSDFALCCFVMMGAMNENLKKLQSSGPVKNDGDEA